MKTYSEFYEEAKTKYGKNTEGHSQAGPEFDLYSFCMWHQKPEQKGIFTFSEDYLKNVNTLSEHIKNTIEIKENQLVPSVLKSISSSIPVKEPIIRYKNVWDLPGLEEICEELIPQIESKILGSHSYIYGLYAYRNKPCERKPRASWLWHYDNHPKETLKLMIYLTDTGEDNGCFEVMSTKDNSVLKKPTLRIDDKKWESHHSRINSPELEELKKSGYSPKKILGPKGTVCLFDNNIVHRASTAKVGYRDAVVLLLRPWHEKIRPYISKEYTGSNNHVDVFRDPSFFGVKRK